MMVSPNMFNEDETGTHLYSLKGFKEKEEDAATVNAFLGFARNPFLVRRLGVFRWGHRTIFIEGI